jgi:GntR family transcriptional regulator of gluconate operon
MAIIIQSTDRHSTISVNRETLSSQLAAKLRLAIVRGELAPGARLTEQALASQASVSRTTVREALRILAKDGLVRLVPMSGARVMTLAQEDVREINEARIALETFASRSLASLPSVDLTKLEEGLKDLVDAVRAQRWGAIIDADVAFHRSAVAATGNSRLLALWQALEAQVRLYLTYQAQEAYDLGHLVEVHRFLLEAIRSGDPDRAGEAFRVHIVERIGRREQLWKTARVSTETKRSRRRRGGRTASE